FRDNFKFDTKIAMQRWSIPALNGSIHAFGVRRPNLTRGELVEMNVSVLPAGLSGIDNIIATSASNAVSGGIAPGVVIGAARGSSSAYASAGRASITAKRPIDPEI